MPRTNCARSEAAFSQALLILPQGSCKITQNQMVAIEDIDTLFAVTGSGAHYEHF